MAVTFSSWPPKPDVGDLLPGRATLDLEDGPRDGAAGVAVGRRQQLGDPGGQRPHAGAGDRRAEEHRVHQRLPGLAGQLGPEPPEGDGRPAVDVGGQQPLVVVGEQVDQPGGEAGVTGR
jgi:hypothetical protein